MTPTVVIENSNKIGQLASAITLQNIVGEHINWIQKLRWVNQQRKEDQKELEMEQGSDTSDVVSSTTYYVKKRENLGSYQRRCDRTSHVQDKTE